MSDYDNAPTNPHHGGKIWLQTYEVVLYGTFTRDIKRITAPRSSEPSLSKKEKESQLSPSVDSNKGIGG